METLENKAFEDKDFLERASERPVRYAVQTIVAIPMIISGLESMGTLLSGVDKYKPQIQNLTGDLGVVLAYLSATGVGIAIGGALAVAATLGTGMYMDKKFYDESSKTTNKAASETPPSKDIQPEN